MKTLSFFLVGILMASGTSAQTQARTQDGKDVILEPNGTWHYAQLPAPATATPTLGADCEKYSVGNILIINKSEFRASGRMSFRTVDKQSKDVTSLIWEEFTLEPDSSITYADVLNGAVQLKYGFYKPDPSAPKGYSYGSVRNVADSAVTCKVRDINLREK